MACYYQTVATIVSYSAKYMNRHLCSFQPYMKPIENLGSGTFHKFIGVYILTLRSDFISLVNLFFRKYFHWFYVLYVVLNKKTRCRSFRFSIKVTLFSLNTGVKYV